jgi:hypothetical protein
VLTTISENWPGVNYARARKLYIEEVIVGKRGPSL